MNNRLTIIDTHKYFDRAKVIGDKLLNIVTIIILSGFFLSIKEGCIK